MSPLAKLTVLLVLIAPGILSDDPIEKVMFGTYQLTSDAASPELKALLLAAEYPQKFIDSMKSDDQFFIEMAKGSGPDEYLMFTRSKPCPPGDASCRGDETKFTPGKSFSKKRSDGKEFTAVITFVDGKILKMEEDYGHFLCSFKYDFSSGNCLKTTLTHTDKKSGKTTEAKEEYKKL